MNDWEILAVVCLLVVFFRLPFWQSPSVDRFVERVIVGLVVAAYFVLVIFGWGTIIEAVLRGGLR